MASELDSDPKGLWRIVAWVWQGHLLDLLDRREEALIWYGKASQADFRDSMQHSQYGIDIDAGWIEDRLHTPITRE